jgi:thiaminase (transcriptional activator TenA)
MPKSLSDTLRAASDATWSATVDHRFMQALRDGSLDSATFARFLIQDYRFVERLLVLLAAAITLADTFASRLRIAQAVGGLAASEDVFFKDAFRMLGVDAAEMQKVPAAEANAAFAALMQEAADSGSYAGVIAILCQADWLYLDCATRPVRAVGGSLHRRWVEQYSNDDVRSFVAFLRQELDRVGRNDETRAQHFFHKANELELAFLDALF